MTTGSTNLAPDTRCPKWCTTDHNADDLDDQIHDGPRFGALLQVSTFRGVAAGSIFLPSEPDGLTAQDLRQLAADAIAAAGWIEAQR